ncbi:MAG: 50S ribosomal protein L24 [Clostridiales bacterium]|nr:50S ribosomal protein L24 [Clostridiales bacterium]
MSVKKGDNVMVITGKDKGKVGKVLAVNPDTNRIYVEGVNIVSRSKKPRNAQDQGGIIKREGTIDVSNVMHVCSSCGEVIRVKHEVKDVDGKQKSVRVCPKCGAALDEKKASAKKAAKKAAKKKTEKSDK